ncbi:retinal guanylyl cyclase 2 isoform X4 [Saccopteryx bilineata]|uniref:retinal guanylyl cyclase 2 isoform X4 n=1 Tax=Saccopteryx bilineata TaxID=59482 RepID=UPI00338DA0B4
MFSGLWPFFHLMLHFKAPRRQQEHHDFGSFKLLWWLCLLALTSLPQQVWAPPYKIGIVGPWACDQLFSKALPEAAARLAIERINKDPSFDLGYSFEYVILNEDCQTSSALSSFISHHQMASVFIGPANPGYCEAAALLGNSWDKGIFSWACVNYELNNKNSYPTFLRTIASPIRVLVTVMEYFQWAHAGVISSDEDIWVHTANQVANALRSHGLPVGVVLTTGQDNQSIWKALQQIHRVDQIRIIIMCMHSALIGGETQTHLLEWAHDLKMTDGTYVFIPYDALLYSLPYKHTPYQVLKNNSKLREAYDAVLTITVESQEKTFYQAYTEAAARGEISEKLESDQRGSRASVSFQITSEVQSGRSPRLSFSSGSLTPATYENSNIAIYEGDWVWLKKFPSGDFGDVKSIKSSASDMFEMMKDLRHENVNPLLGFFYDLGMFAIVTEFCSRRSLEDILMNEDVKLDWMFKSSLLLDLIKGMKYLHHREFAHGRLKSRNCVVDGRFVLKVTDYGYNDILEKLRLPQEEPSAEELLWMAPELLRTPKGSRLGSLAGDVYSFAIIMQEVMVRGTPFCMMDLPAEEIIERLKEPPPVYRPVVPPEHAPPECLQLMKQCWAEAAEQRPTFDEIFNQFKTFNKGKKTNIIDSMLRMLEQYSSNLEDLIRERTEELEIEKQKTETLLTQMLPPSVAESLKKGCTVEPEGFDLVTLYFSDIVGFTTISAMSEPIEVVDLLNDLYTLFDAIIGSHDVYKVETIGDAYMVASGLPKRNGSRHAAEIANMSLDILSSVGTFKMRHMPEVPVRIRIGLHSGPVVAGVVGLTMPRYCLFGDTVNTASRMESTGLPYRIHVSHSTVTILQALSEGYELELRGRTELKGKGTEETFWLVGKKSFTKPLPVPPPVGKDGQVGHGLQPVEIAAFQRRKAERQLVRNKP